MYGSSDEIDNALKEYDDAAHGYQEAMYHLLHDTEEGRKVLAIRDEMYVKWRRLPIEHRVGGV